MKISDLKSYQPLLSIVMLGDTSVYARRYSCGFHKIWWTFSGSRRWLCYTGGVKSGIGVGDEREIYFAMDYHVAFYVIDILEKLIRDDGAKVWIMRDSFHPVRVMEEDVVSDDALDRLIDSRIKNTGTMDYAVLFGVIEVEQWSGTWPLS